MSTVGIIKYIAFSFGLTHQFFFMNLCSDWSLSLCFAKVFTPLAVFFMERILNDPIRVLIYVALIVSMENSAKFIFFTAEYQLTSEDYFFIVLFIKKVASV